MNWRIFLIALGFCGVTSACLDTRRGTVGDTRTSDPDAGQDVEVPDIAVVDVSDDIEADTIASDPCFCGPDQVYRHGPCVPTLELGCGPACIGDGDCAEGFSCDDCAASSSCGTRDCQSACAVTYAPHAPVPDPLRLAPTSLPATGGTVVISGTQYYIGALGHRVRVAGGPFLDMPGGTTCALEVVIPAGLPDGVHRLEVSQYSGDEPWVTAGFLFKGRADDGCIQPGFPCRTDTVCCSDATSRWTCRDGRCRAF